MRFNLILILIICPILCFGQGSGLYMFTGKNKKYGFMDKTGNVKVKPEYASVTNFFNDVSFVSKRNAPKGYLWTCIDTLGNILFEGKGSIPCTNFNEGFARLKNDDEHWFIDKKGNKLFNKTWQDGYENYKNGIAYVSDAKGADAFYPIDTNGNRVGTTTYTKFEISQKTKEAEPNSKQASADGLIKFKQDSLWGFKNLKGEVVVKPQYYGVDKFENGICAVQAKRLPINLAIDRYFDTIINTKGEILNQLPMHNYHGFRGELISYSDSYAVSFSYLDKNGQKVIPKE